MSLVEHLLPGMPGALDAIVADTPELWWCDCDVPEQRPVRMFGSVIVADAYECGRCHRSFLPVEVAS